MLIKKFKKISSYILTSAKHNIIIDLALLENEC